MQKVVLGLGSNIGDRGAYLRRAVDSLSSILQDIAFSSVYQTAPQDYEQQDDFFNMVVIGYYDGEPLHLLEEIKQIEETYGRAREKEIKKGPRTLDIDILFFGSLILDMPALTIPHPAIKKRAFVLIPLLELVPEFHAPDDTFLYKDILLQLKDQRVERVGELARV